MKYSLEHVTDKPALWESSDPVQPGLDVAFKTAKGRGVFGLKNNIGDWKAFMCYARTFLIPKDVDELTKFTNEDGNVVIPYTVWSHEKGSGRIIINEVLQYVRANPSFGVDRVVTLSPQTEMARRFHVRNGASVFRLNDETVNFEYDLND